MQDMCQSTGLENIHSLHIQINEEHEKEKYQHPQIVYQGKSTQQWHVNRQSSSILLDDY